MVSSLIANHFEVVPPPPELLVELLGVDFDSDLLSDFDAGVLSDLLSDFDSDFESDVEPDLDSPLESDLPLLDLSDALPELE
jgi:hypothetical protein